VGMNVRRGVSFMVNFKAGYDVLRILGDLPILSVSIYDLLIS